MKLTVLKEAHFSPARFTSIIPVAGDWGRKIADSAVLAALPKALRSSTEKLVSEVQPPPFPRLIAPAPEAAEHVPWAGLWMPADVLVGR